MPTAVATRVRVESKHLAGAASWIAQIVPSRPRNPTLGGVRLTAEGQTLRLSCFDYEVQGEVEIACDGEMDILVPARDFASMVARLDAVAYLELDGSRLTIKSPGRNFKLGVMPMGDYPDLPAIPAPAGEGDSLGEALEAALVAVSDSVTTPQLLGIHIQAGGGQVVLRSSDQYRAVRIARDWTGGQLEALPNGRWIAAALKGYDGPVQVGCDGNRIGLHWGNHSWACTLIDSPFPVAAVDQFFDGPAQPGMETRDIGRFDGQPTLVVSRAELLRAIQDALIATDASLPRVCLRVIEGLVTVSTEGSEAAAGHEVEAKVTGAFSPEVWIQASYLTDALNTIRLGDVRLHDIPTGGKTLPLLIRGLLPLADGDSERLTDPSHDYLIVKLRDPREREAS